MSERISIYPKICHGQACIAGTRIPVHQVVRMFAHGDSIEALLKAYPSVTREEQYPEGDWPGLLLVMRDVVQSAYRSS